jgi:hypothetical protein
MNTVTFDESAVPLFSETSRRPKKKQHHIQDPKERQKIIKK